MNPITPPNAPAWYSGSEALAYRTGYMDALALNGADCEPPAVEYGVSLLDDYGRIVKPMSSRAEADATLQELRRDKAVAPDEVYLVSRPARAHSWVPAVPTTYYLEEEGVPSTTKVPERFSTLEEAQAAIRRIVQREPWRASNTFRIYQSDGRSQTLISTTTPSEGAPSA